MYKLLIVDDEYVEIEALTYIVENSTLPIATILTASNGRQAIELSKEHTPDIIIMDIKMPGITGTEAAILIKEFCPYSKIVFLSAYNYFDYAQEAIRLEASDFLIKPVSNETLIEVLSRLIANKEKESRELQLTSSIETQFKQISTFFENELINYLLFADIKKHQLEEYFQALDCHPEYLHTIVISIDEHSLESLSSLKATMIKRRCIKTFKERIQPFANRCFGNFNKNWLYLLVIVPTPIPKDKAELFFQETIKTIQNNYYVTCRAAISDVITNIMNINESLLVMKHEILFNQDKSQIIYPISKYKTSNNFSLKKEQMLLEAIQLDNTTRILTISSEYSNWLKQSSYSTKEIKYLLFGSLSMIVKTLSNLRENVSPQLFNIVMAYISKLENNDNIDTLCSCFNDQLLTIADIFSDNRENVDSPIVMKLCTYIDENYMHDLSLKDLASNVDMNSQYISKHFKDIKGVNFSDYLTDVRICNAKVLLTTTHKSIQDIGLSVGYNDSNYFTRAFKKHETLTPKQYRSKAYRHKK